MQRDAPSSDENTRSTEPDAMEEPGSEQDLPLSAAEDEPEIEPFRTPTGDGDHTGGGHGYGYE